MVGTYDLVQLSNGFSPSLRAKRSNPETFRGNSLDCFVGSLLAMTMVRDKQQHSRGMICPSCANHRALKSEGAGNAG
jgi:hypothetical protein